MGKVDTKKAHRPGKVHLSKSAKSKINLTLTIDGNKVRKPPTCLLDDNGYGSGNRPH